MVVLFSDTNTDHVVKDCYVRLCCSLIPITDHVVRTATCGCVVADTNKDHVSEDCYREDCCAVVLFSDTNKDHAVRTATCGCVVR